MKKILVLSVALLFVAGFAFADSGSMVQGTFYQGNGAIVTPSFSNPTLSGAAIANGGQNGGGSFSANPSNPGGESATGGGNSAGVTNVSASVVHVDGSSITSTAHGDTSNNGAVNVSEVGDNTAKLNLNGNGSMLTGTQAVIGADGNGNITNGGFAGANTIGGFSYFVNGGAGSWIGNGSTSGDSVSQVSKIPNGFSAFSSASVNSTACPVK